MSMCRVWIFSFSFLKIQCEITSASGGKTLFSEISHPFETGLVLEDSDNILSLIKDGQPRHIILKQKIPLSCSYDSTNESCYLRVDITHIPESKCFIIISAHGCDLFWNKFMLPSKTRIFQLCLIFEELLLN